MRSRTLARFAVVAVAAMGAACSDKATTEPRDAGEVSLDNWVGKVLGIGKAARDGDLEGCKAAVDVLVTTSVQSNKDAKGLGVPKCGEGA